MKHSWTKRLSILLVLVMLFQMLPHQVLAETISTEDSDLSVNLPSTETPAAENAQVIDEVVENRTEFTKEFQMSNGFSMAVVYPEAVHYEKDGQWRDIDNTLVATTAATEAVYTNAEGLWNIQFPQQLSQDRSISVTKDGYTLRFSMAGTLSDNGNVSVMSTGDISTTFAVQQAQTSTAQIEQLNTAALRAMAEHPETVQEKLTSRLLYQNVYPNTNIIYDLQSNQLKESVVIGHYDSDLRGYRYALDVGELIPVLNEDNSIGFYDSDRENVVMVMPAPFLIDDANIRSNDVEVVLQGSGSDYTLYYLLPTQWLAEEERAWPVILDPVIQANITPQNIWDISVAENIVDDIETGTVSCGYGNNWGVHRFYVMYDELPDITSADVIISAQMDLVKYGETYNNSETMTVEVHKVNEVWDSPALTWSNMPSWDDTVEDYALVKEWGHYYWDVTDIVRGWYEGENTGMMFKASDDVEDARVLKYKEFYSSDYGIYYRPTLLVYFRNNNGLEGYWDYTTNSAGRAGTGYVNNYTGNLVWVRSDLGFGGNRMPVSINHIYNTNDSLNNIFGMGYGWRTNFNQRVYVWSENSNYYVWEDSDGTKHYFLWESTGTYKDEDGLELTLTTTGSGAKKYCITDKNGNKSYFDTYGRLRSQENNQATKSTIIVEYTTTSGFLIDYIKDGATRKYDFTYSNNLLSKISFLGTGTTELTNVSFVYSGSNLTKVNYSDGESVSYSYITNHLLSSATDVDGYKLTYTYTTTAAGRASRVEKVTESDGNVQGGELTFEYGQNQTTMTDYKGNVQLLQFNNWGNTVSIQDGLGRAQYAGYAANNMGDPGKGNQLQLASKLQNTVVNLISNHSFEDSPLWTVISSAVSRSKSSTFAYLGSYAQKLSRSAAGSTSGLETSFDAEPGKTYTLSAYVKTGTARAWLGVKQGSTTVTSEILPKGSDWTRLQVSYTNSTSNNQTVKAQLLTDQAGAVYIDCVQVEEVPTASRYNLIANGDFRFSTGWSASSTTINSPVAAPQTDNHIVNLIGSPTAQNRVHQTVQVSGKKGDTYILGGWAMADSVPLTADDTRRREFGLIAVFNYADGQSEEIPIHFNTFVNEWQYMAQAIVAPADYESITVYIAYDYNANSARFDGIQLFKEEFGSSYTYDDDGNVISVVDLQKRKTEYKYSANNDLTKIIQDGITEMEYAYDNYHNVLSAQSATGLSYAFTYDDWGNNTSVSITSNSKTMTTSATYTQQGNQLDKTTDASGNVTDYYYNPQTNVLEWVKYPNDTDTTRTEYTYDSMYRLAESSVVVGGQTLSAEYEYTDDLLTKLVTGSTTYHFAYGDFALRSSIKVGSTTLATYAYESRTNLLKTLAYGNGDRVQYTYDDLGRIKVQTYEDGSTVTYAYDNDGALATVTDSATGRKITYYYDFTGRLMKYAETGDGHEHIVTYSYDLKNNLSAVEEIIDGNSRTVTYTYDNDNRVIQTTEGPTGTTSITTRTYTYDGFGRITKRTTKHHDGTSQTEEFSYVTDGAETSNQVHKLTNKAGTFEYTYDDNGNILSVTHGGKKTTYSYDTANQLIREDNQAAGKTWMYTYDDAGNILTKKEYAYTIGTVSSATASHTYTYGNTNWGDLLTKYDDIRIYHDEIGNLVRFSTNTYTWEHGRQLASMGVGSDFAILEQPENSVGALGDDICFSVVARGNGLSYLWQISNDNGASWSTSTAQGYNTPSISGFEMNATRNGRLYRCKITDASGNVLYSKPAEVVLVDIHISSQPEDFYGKLGDTCTFSVEASGDSLTYRWQVSTDGGGYWGSSSADGYKTASMTVELQDHNPGYLYRCKITDASGNVVYSEPGEIRNDALAIVTQPEDFVGIMGDTVRFTIEARGEGLTYQWQSSVNGGKSWSASTAGGNKTASMTVLLQDHNPGYLYRCKVTDANGNVVYSEPGMIRAGQITWDFTYDANGLRTKRTNGTTTYDYIYNGSQLAQMTVDGHTLNFAYDVDGKPAYVVYDGTKYFYLTNLQGDVVAIADRNGGVLVEYTYDAWGNILSTTGSMASTLGKYNPLRYRGYVYDTESSLYYLQSRYYDPALGRFINADAYPSTGQGLTGNNMFAYCGNNPVSRQDCAGTLWETLLGAAIGGGLAGALVGAVSHLVNCGINGDEVTVSGLLGAAANGAVLGALGAVSGVVEGAALAGSAIVGIVTGVSAIMNTEGSAGEKLLSGLSSGFLAGMGTYLGTKMPIAQGDILSSAVSAFAGGLMLGAQTETCVVLAQQAVGAIGKGNSPAPSSGTYRQISTVAAY